MGVLAFPRSEISINVQLDYVSLQLRHYIEVPLTAFTR